MFKAEVTQGIQQHAARMMGNAIQVGIMAYITIGQRRHAAVEVALLREKTHVVKSFGDAVLDQCERTQN
jgi:hypothetical protein